MMMKLNQLVPHKQVDHYDNNYINQFLIQENLTVKLDTLKQEMLKCYEELNRLDEDNLT